MTSASKQLTLDLTERVPAPVAEEVRILARVQDAIEHKPKRRNRINYQKSMVELRDALETERLPEDRASILEQMHRLANLAVHEQRRVEAEQINPDSPYFAHMRLVEYEGRTRDILLGKNTFISDGVTVVDWRNAPVSKVFYQLDEGDEYELNIDNSLLAGEVAVRRTVSIQRGELLRVATPSRTFVSGDGGWQDLSANQPALSGGAGMASRPDLTAPVLGRYGSSGERSTRRVDKHLPEIASLLDPEQFTLITEPDGGIVAVHGSAGSGKTTVALHRVAYLAYQDPKRFKPKRTLIIVYNRALARYISKVLPALGVVGVPVQTFAAWAESLRRRHFSGFPNRRAADTPAAVTRFKLHSVLLSMLKEGAEQRPQLPPDELFDELFTDGQWIEETIARCPPEDFRPTDVDTIRRYCARQQSVRADEGGHTEGELPTLDEEDDAILLYLHQLVVGPLTVGKKRRTLEYSHLVVDEVQDMSPIELRVLMGTVAANAPVTLAGDTAQSIIEGSDFRDWTHTLDVLGLDHIKLSDLKISYRSTRSIMRLARDVLGSLAPADPLRAPRDGAPVELFHFSDPGACATFLTDTMRTLVEREPSASVAILARYAHQADAAYQALRRAEVPTLYRVLDQDFRFVPGIEVTEIHQAKGLEFDYVIVLDCDRGSFLRDPVSRRLLHVAITRAAHQCWVTTIGPPSALLPPSLVERTIEA